MNPKPRTLRCRLLRPMKFMDRVYSAGDHVDLPEDIVDRLHKENAIVLAIPAWLEKEDPSRARRLATVAPPRRTLNEWGHPVETGGDT